LLTLAVSPGDLRARWGARAVDLRLVLVEQIWRNAIERALEHQAALSGLWRRGCSCTSLPTRCSSAASTPICGSRAGCAGTVPVLQLGVQGA
jgi:hypothetical protein